MRNRNVHAFAAVFPQRSHLFPPCLSLRILDFSSCEICFCFLFLWLMMVFSHRMDLVQRISYGLPDRITCMFSKLIHKYINYKYIRTCLSSRIFEDLTQKNPEILHRSLVTVVRIFIGGLLSWLVSWSTSVPEQTSHGVGRGLYVNP